MERLTERLIRKAQEDGHFDDLPRQGRSLELEDDAAAGEMAMAHHLLHNAGMAPPWIETDKEARSRWSDIEALLARATRSPTSAANRLVRELEALMDSYDDAVVRLEGLAPTARQQRPRLDRERQRQRLRAALERRPGLE